MSKKLSVFFIILVAFCNITEAQTGERSYYNYEIDECGDTVIVAELNHISVSAPALVDNAAIRRYKIYRQYAVKVYPYATKAIEIFRKQEALTNHMDERYKREYLRLLHKELKEEFEDPLKKLTRTQGMILIKMIEKELDTPLYFLIKNLKGGINATYWSTLGKFFGHRIKEGYQKGEDPILDMVLNDFNIAYNFPFGKK
ncbi:MAG: DUF4294 domain-containing protein [Saprospiraceae bacterium]|jgi:hypothetical protein